MKRPTLRAFRRGTQISVALAFVIVPWLNHLGISSVYGNFLAFNLAGFPLADPLAVLQVTLKNRYLPLDLLIGAGVALVLAVVSGTVFCSWICPYGLFSEVGNFLSINLRKRRHQGLRAGVRRGFRIKSVLFCMGLAGFFLFSTTPVLSQLSLPAWYSRIFQFWFEQRHISLAILAIAGILVIETISGRRLWCRFICPQAVLLVAAKCLNPFRLKVGFQREKCICQETSDPCGQACTLQIDPQTIQRVVETECNNCGDCIVACNQRGRALGYTFTLKAESTPVNPIQSR